MFKQVLASAAALALMTGVAFAQEQQTTTHERTTVQGPDEGQSVEHKTVQRTTTHHRVSRHHHKTQHTDGSEVSRSHEERTSSPDGDTSTRQETTTTHDNH
jgi:hypothetical protein